MTESLALLHAHLNEIRDFAGIPKREELLDWNTWKDFLSSMLTKSRKRRNQSTFLFLQSFLCQQEFLGMVQCYPWRQGTLWDEHNSAGFDSHWWSFTSNTTTLSWAAIPILKKSVIKLPFDICKTLQPSVLLQCLNRGDQQWPTDNKSNYNISGMMISSAMTGLWEPVYNEKWGV